MKELISIIKEGLKDFRGDAVNLIAENISAKLIDSGLAFEGQVERMAESFDATQQRILNDANKEQFSDGYHTFSELYEFRKVYNAALFNDWASQAEYTSSGFEILPVKHDVHKSWCHNDGELCFGGGWFIVVANLPTGQISNHYEAKDWDLFRVPETPTAKYAWDGHTSKDVLKRLMAL